MSSSGRKDKLITHVSISYKRFPSGGGSNKFVQSDRWIVYTVKVEHNLNMKQAVDYIEYIEYNIEYNIVYIVTSSLS